jgi:hypothetical protein
MSDCRLTIPQAAERLQWSVRFLKSRLAAHNIRPIGNGRAARLTEEDLKQLEAKERQPCRTSSSRPESEGPTGTFGGRTPEAALRSQQARRLARMLRNGQTPGSSLGPVSVFPAPVRR